jgi:thiol-disulfide isomerase/thioredoxin
MRSTQRIALAAAILVLPLALPAGVLLQPKPAPEWHVSEWLNEDPGRLADHRNQVVLIEFFQMWCPGSNRFSKPLIERWKEKYAGRDDVMIVSIHTVFEGHAHQTPEMLRELVAARGTDHPVGIDAFASEGDPTPITMERYETEGTPHIAIIDKQGQLRYSEFGIFDPGPIEAFIDRLLKEEPPKGGSERKPPSRR